MDDEKRFWHKIRFWHSRFSQSYIKIRNPVSKLSFEVNILFYLGKKWKNKTHFSQYLKNLKNLIFTFFQPIFMSIKIIRTSTQVQKLLRTFNLESTTWWKDLFNKNNTKKCFPKHGSVNEYRLSFMALTSPLLLTGKQNQSLK